MLRGRPVHLPTVCQTCGAGLNSTYAWERRQVDIICRHCLLIWGAIDIDALERHGALRRIVEGMILTYRIAPGVKLFDWD